MIIYSVILSFLIQSYCQESTFITIEPPNNHIKNRIEKRYEKAVIDIDFLYENNGYYAEIDKTDLQDYYEVWIFELPVIPERWYKYIFKYEVISINGENLSTPDGTGITIKNNYE